MIEAIPVIQDPERYVSSEFSRDSFVEITSGGRFDVQMQYPLLGMRNAEPHCYVREAVYDRLLKAGDLLPQGYRIRFWDAWRPFALQDELYETYSREIIKDFGLEGTSREQREAVIRKFVSDPIPDRNVPPVHTTGGAVDVTLLDETGAELDMGTAFDAFTDLTHTAAFENGGDLTVRDHRRLLYHVMTTAGFVNLPSEWWHYDYGDRFWAYYTHRPAMFEGVFVRGELYGT